MSTPRSPQASVEAVRGMVAAADDAIAELELALSEEEELTFDRVLMISRARQQHSFANAELQTLYERLGDGNAS